MAIKVMAYNEYKSYEERNTYPAKSMADAFNLISELAVEKLADSERGRMVVTVYDDGNVVAGLTVGGE